MRTARRHVREACAQFGLPFWRMWVRYLRIPPLSQEGIEDAIQRGRDLAEHLEDAGSARQEIAQLRAQQMRKYVAAGLEFIQQLQTVDMQADLHLALGPTLDSLCQNADCRFTYVALIEVDEQGRVKDIGAAGGELRLSILRERLRGASSKLLREAYESVTPIVMESGPDKGPPDPVYGALAAACDPRDDVRGGSLIRVGNQGTYNGVLGLFGTEEQLSPRNTDTLDERLLLPALVGSGITAILADRAQITALAERKAGAERHLQDMAHELNLPLMAMIGHCENLRDDVLEATLKRRAMDDVLFQAESLANIVDNYHMAKEEDDTPLPTTMQNLGVFLRRVAHPYSSFAGHTKGATIRVHRSTNVKVPIHEQRFRQVVVNLLDNAVKYCEEKTNIQISCKVTEDWVSMTVQSDGLEISDVDLPHIFESQFRGEEAKVTVTSGGSGRGLNVVKVIMARHGGRCEADSTLGPYRHRTRVTVLLPRRPSAGEEVIDT